LGVLANRRQQILDEQVLRLPVPRWSSPRLEIEYRPVPHAILRRGVNEQEKRIKDSTDPSKQAATEIDTNADILINGCIRIIAILENGEEIGLGLDGAFTRFDRDAVIASGLPENSTMRQLCRWMFVTDADLLRTARTVSKWSGYTTDDVNEALEGE
jgi:hypothetical protein